MEKKAFTLVELLVVVAIITILAAMLLPVLEKSLREARMLCCASQQKQIAVAVNSYGNENADRLPPTINTMDGIPRSTFDPLYAFSWIPTNITTNVIAIPNAAVSFFLEPYANAGDIFFCPLAESGYARAAIPLYRSRTVNSVVCSYALCWNIRHPAVIGSTVIGPSRLTDKPSSRLTCDAIWASDMVYKLSHPSRLVSGKYANFWTHGEPASSSAPPGITMNASYLDCHVRTYMSENTTSYGISRPTYYPLP